jgi:hypothetical protein
MNTSMQRQIRVEIVKKQERSRKEERFNTKIQHQQQIQFPEGARRRSIEINKGTLVKSSLMAS